MENKNDFNFDMFEQGKRLETERPNAEQKEKKKQEKRKKEKRLNIAAGVIIALIAAAALVLAAPIFFAKYNPERLAKQYVEAVINKDYGSVYDKSEGKRFADFGRDEFVAACEANPELIKICSGEVKDFRVEKYGAPDGDFQNMLVTCVCTSEDGAGEVAEQYIFPVQMINNGFWKYDEYAAVITFDIICRAKIYAPRQTTVSINGEQLADTACEVKTASAADGGSFTYLEYSVEPMLAGTYTVSAENSYCAPYEESIDINKLNSEIYIYLTLSDDGLQQLNDAAKSNLTTLIGKAAENSVDPASLPITESFAANGFEELSKNTEQELYAAVENISVSDFAIADISLTKELDKMPSLTSWNEPRVTLDLTFNYTYKLTNSAYTYSAGTEDRNGTGYAIITYTFADGKWQIDDLALQAKF